MNIGKRHKENLSNCDRNLEYELSDAVSLMKGLSTTKFDESVDVAINLGVDPRHADQLVRGTVSLPNGTGKNVRVVVIAKDDDKINTARDAGADESGFEELLSKIEKGWMDFDV